jgi:predicted SAM-dependent methyltransferase
VTGPLGNNEAVSTVRAFISGIPGVTPAYRAASSVLRRSQLRRHSTVAKPLRIIVGSSGIHEPGWFPTDVDILDLLNRGDWERFFAGHPIDAILAEHVWEHLTPDQGLVAARHCFEFLAPGGYLRFAVPDGLHPDAWYRDYCRPGGAGPGADDHKVFYDYRSALEMFRLVGFEVRLLEYFDEQGCFQSVGWSTEQGTLRRTARFDPRNEDNRLVYTSVALDAIKPTHRDRT